MTPTPYTPGRSHLKAVKDGTRIRRIPLEVPAEIKNIGDAQTFMEVLVAAAYQQGHDDATAELAEFRPQLRAIRGSAS